MKIEIRTGSDSDISHIKELINLLKLVGVDFDLRVLSAHRTPERMINEARKLEKKGFILSVAVAGGSAHLPGMTASETLLPVLAIPVLTKNFNGLDSLLSSLQMPEGVPLGVLPINDSYSTFLFILKLLNYLSSYILFDGNIYEKLVKNLFVEKSDLFLNIRKNLEKLSKKFNYLKKYNVSEKIIILIDDKIKNKCESYYKKIIQQKIDLQIKLGIEFFVYHFDPDNIEDLLLDIKENNDKSSIIVFEYFSYNPLICKISSSLANLVVHSFVLDKEENIDFNLLLNIFNKKNKFDNVTENLFPNVFTGVNRIENCFLFLLKIIATKNSKIKNFLKNYKKVMKKKVVKIDKEVKLKTKINNFLFL
ncbi:MAG: AIR carboxylase family protein [Spirochaetes bacterium]|nr:AIR carboxylase family protein [Spirochaetota bacterium]